ncbi:MAG: large subunit ribosomal protein L4e [Patescibacteria group bacterium]|jgi:large subunit ribosomal protein L4e
MNTKLFDKAGKESGTVDLPKMFEGNAREDILAKVFEAEKMAKTQVYGAKPGAGAGYSASGILRHRRSVWKTTYGKGISRVPRKIMSRSGSSFNWVGATISSARGGRKPHAPKAEKVLTKKINKKELAIAFNAAFIGTVSPKYIEKKYNMKGNSGFVVSDDVAKLKTKDFLVLMQTLFGDAYAKLEKRKAVRAGRGKTRGRKYKSNAGMLFVVGSQETVKRSGITVVKAKELQISDLSPNGQPGRFTCYTKKAITEIGEKFK